MSRSAYGLDTMRGDSWRDHAVCASQNPKMFTPELPAATPSALVRRAYDDDVLKALRICGTCPEQIKAACLADAYATGDRWTIRGGTTGEQRVQNRRRKALADLYQARADLAEVAA